jgi:hypothetical protein
MRLSDPGLRQRQLKLIYPDHRLPPWLNEDAPRDRSNRLLVVICANANSQDVCACAQLPRRPLHHREFDIPDCRKSAEAESRDAVSPAGGRFGRIDSEAPQTAIRRPKTPSQARGLDLPNRMRLRQAPPAPREETAASSS